MQNLKKKKKKKKERDLRNQKIKINKNSPLLLVSCELKLRYFKSWKSQPNSGPHQKIQPSKADVLKHRSDVFTPPCILIHDTYEHVKKISERSTVQVFMFGRVPACTMPRDLVAWGHSVAFPDEFGHVL